MQADLKALDEENEQLFNKNAKLTRHLDKEREKVK